MSFWRYMLFNNLYYIWQVINKTINVKKRRNCSHKQIMKNKSINIRSAVCPLSFPVPCVSCGFKNNFFGSRRMQCMYRSLLSKYSIPYRTGLHLLSMAKHFFKTCNSLYRLSYGRNHSIMTVFQPCQLYSTSS